MELNENERIDDLEFKNLKIIQNKLEFCFGIDSVLLSDYAKTIKNNSRVIDLGTGTGILPILLSGKTDVMEIIGIEIQENMAEMAKRSVNLNNLGHIIKIINGDIRDIKSFFNTNSFDVVITNPPYKKNYTGLKNLNKGKLISKHEIKCNLEDIIMTAKYLLKNNGEFFMVHRPERLVDIIYLMRKNNIEPKNIRFVYSRKNSEANLILIKGVKNGRPFLKVEKPLYIYDENNFYTEEMLKIYNKERN